MLRTPKQIAKEQRDWPFLTSAGQAYPGPLNTKLCEVLIKALDTKPIPVENSMVLTGKWKNVLKRKSLPQEGRSVRARLEFTTPLKGKRKVASDKHDEEEQYLGGMRNPRQALQRLPGYRQAGIVIYKVLISHLEKNQELRDACLDAIGCEDANAGPAEDSFADLRKEISEMLDPHIEDVPVDSLDSQLQARLLWQMAPKLW